MLFSYILAAGFLVLVLLHLTREELLRCVLADYLRHDDGIDQLGIEELEEVKI